MNIKKYFKVFIFLGLTLLEPFSFAQLASNGKAGAFVKSTSMKVSTLQSASPTATPIQTTVSVTGSPIAKINPLPFKASPPTTCKAKHNAILQKYADKLDSQISLLVKGINYETLASRDPIKIAEYRVMLKGLIVNRVLVSEMMKQLATVDYELGWRNGETMETKSKKVFNLDNVIVDMKIAIPSVIEQAMMTNVYTDTMSASALKVLGQELFTETIQELSESVMKPVGKGIMAKIIRGSFKKAAINEINNITFVSFSGGIAAGLLVGAAADAVIATFGSAQDSPDAIWGNIINEYPLVILNPEMNPKSGGVSSEAWGAHCDLLSKYPAMIQATALTSSLDFEFKRNLKNIHKPATTECVTGTQVFVEQIDAVKVKYEGKVDDSLPIWAR